MVNAPSEASVYGAPVAVNPLFLQTHQGADALRVEVSDGMVPRLNQRKKVLVAPLSTSPPTSLSSSPTSTSGTATSTMMNGDLHGAADGPPACDGAAHRRKGSLADVNIDGDASGACRNQVDDIANADQVQPAARGLDATQNLSNGVNGYLALPSVTTKRAPAPSPMRRAQTLGGPALQLPTTSSSGMASGAHRTRSPQRTMSHGPMVPTLAASATSPASPTASDSEAAFQNSLARQAEEIRKERAERRRQNAEQDRHAPQRLVVKGNPIDDGHSSWLLMFNMLTGIRVAVSRCEAKVKRPLTKADYKATTKFSFDTLGNELTPSVGHDFKFKDYAPWVFRDLREQFCVDPADYLVSLTAKYILSELGSPGKSGSFFYYSSDFRYIIKTVSRSEHRFLRSILQAYHAHVLANPHTLLSRFYGLHRVKMPKGRKIHFVLMNNLFPPHRDVHETYDLKGSSQGREYPEEKAKENPGAVLKDLNWVRRGRQFELGPEKRAFLEEQLRRDVELLARERIMDYSLLVGIHDLSRGNKDNLREQSLSMFKPETGKLRRRPTQVQREADANAFRRALERSDPQALSSADHLPDKDRSEKRHFIFYQYEGGMRATGEHNEPADAIYYLGIIDILTPYTLYKRVEHLAKSFKYDGDTISAVDPVLYASRFLRFMSSSIRGGDMSIKDPALKPKTD